MKIVTIVQARMGSSRLPGKVLAPLAGEPMLRRVMIRLESAMSVDQAVVATTVEALDDELAAVCGEWGVEVWRGSEDDVLDRFHDAAAAHGADAIVRVTSDCPFIDPELLDDVVRAYRERQSEIDYASNINPRRTYPRGLDVEVFSREVLDRIWREEDDPALREHVTPTIWRNPGRFRLHNVTAAADLSHHRWTVDTPEDLLLAQVVYDHFGHDRFAWSEVLELVEARPELTALNAGVRQKEVPAQHDHVPELFARDQANQRTESRASGGRRAAR